jgi:Phage gp6-like head-tail connector protein
VITVEKVKAWLRLTDTADDDLLADVVAATNHWVAQTAYVQDMVRVWPDTGEWPPDVTQGAVMLAARLYRRRNTPGGIDATGPDMAVYVPRRDSDVDLLLHLGMWAPPRVG